MFNVIIENENYSNIDPLIIKEDINDIIQSIEEQLYNINVSYRNNIRKIKNNLKLLDGISESKLVILEETNINDANLISYLTNILEISLDCVVSTLYENKEYRSQLKNVNNIKDLINIESNNTNLFKIILSECEELFNIYSQVNEIEISTTSFYELLDHTIELSVNHNLKNVIPQDIQDETFLYNRVLENIDILISNDLVETYDNIKNFVIEANGGGGGGGNNSGGGGTNSGGGGGGGGRNPGPTVTFNNVPFNQIFPQQGGSDINTPLIIQNLRSIFMTIGGVLGIGSVIGISITIIFGKLIDLILYPFKSLWSGAKSSYNAIRSIFIEELTPEQIAEKTRLINQELKEKSSELTTLKTVIKDKEEILDNLQEQLKTFTQNYWIGGVFATGTLILIFLFVVNFVKSKTLVTNHSIETIKNILKLRKQIDSLKKQTILSFPNLRMQFDFVDSEIKFCEKNAERTNDMIIAYQCSMKYFMACYAIVLYSALIQLEKDGNPIVNFKILNDIHTFNGFGTAGTKITIKQLTLFYDEMIKYDSTLVNNFVDIFYFVKKFILDKQNPELLTRTLLKRY